MPGPTSPNLVEHQLHEEGHQITLKLSDDQKLELSRVTGQELTHLKIGIRDLADIGDLVAN